MQVITVCEYLNGDKLMCPNQIEYMKERPQLSIYVQNMNK